jgi:hypothetical protein
MAGAADYSLASIEPVLGVAEAVLLGREPAEALAAWS